jgi:hypothetical protein
MSVARVALQRSAGLATFWLHDLFLHLLSQLFLGVDEGQCGRTVSVVFGGKRPRLAAGEGQQAVTTLSPFRLLRYRLSGSMSSMAVT